jgi:hypothetical protein
MSGANWRLFPTELVGKRIEMEWSNGNKHKGTVIRYSAYQEHHIVRFDDGTVQEYEMFTRRFWLLGVNGSPIDDGFRPGARPTITPQSTAASAAPSAPSNIAVPMVTNTYADVENFHSNQHSAYPTGYGYAGLQWTPYVSRTQNAASLVTFHVMLDPKVIKDCQVVRINGNLEVMSAWGEGIGMERSPENSSIWSISLHLPFTRNDFHVSGMFQFHFEIVNSDGSIVVEGQGERTEQRVRNHFFYPFRPDYRLPMFRYATALSPKQWYQTFVANEKGLLKSGRIYLDEALDRNNDLFECCNGCVRVHAEQCFEDEIDVVDETVSRVCELESILLIVVVWCAARGYESGTVLIFPFHNRKISADLVRTSCQLWNEPVWSHELCGQ